MFNKKILFISMACISLTACSSMGMQQNITDLNKAKTDLIKYNQHQVLAWNEGTQERSQFNSSPYKAEIITNECAPSFREPATVIIKNLTAGSSFSYEEYATARDTAAEITTEFSNCASNLDAIAEYRFVHSENDEWITINDWVKQMRNNDFDRTVAIDNLNKAREKDASIRKTIGVITAVGLAAVAVAAAAANDNNYSAPAASSYTNSNRHWVNSYYRADGTYVPGHWRSNPNGTCLDNINGC